jgi:arylsulfatase A-like enzyme
MAFSHGLTGKNVPYEESQRVPLIFVGKGIPEGVIDNTTPVCNGWDLIPTMLDMAGIEKPAEQKGLSLYNTMTEDEAIDRQYLYYETVNSFGVLENGRFKYTRFVLKGETPGGTESLFDLEKDPGELFNLADERQYAPKLEELRAALAKQMDHFVTDDSKIIKNI